MGKCDVQYLGRLALASLCPWLGFRREEHEKENVPRIELN